MIVIPAGFALSHGHASSHAHSVLPSAEVAALCSICFSYTASREHKLCHFLSSAPASDSYSHRSGQGSAAELPELSQCEKASSRSERKEAPGGEGTREPDIWHRLCLCHVSQQLY